MLLAGPDLSPNHQQCYGEEKLLVGSDQNHSRSNAMGKEVAGRLRSVTHIAVTHIAICCGEGKPLAASDH